MDIWSRVKTKRRLYKQEYFYLIYFLHTHTSTTMITTRVSLFLVVVHSNLDSWWWLVVVNYLVYIFFRGVVVVVVVPSFFSL